VGDWATVLDPPRAVPFYLTNPDRRYWSARIEGLDAVYVQINAERDEKGGPPLGTFLAGVVAGLADGLVRNAIVDLRIDADGDSTLTIRFTGALPAALPPDGRVFVLTGPGTFSAGVATAARLKHRAGGRAVIVGEQPGDRERHWGEGGTVLLPNSRLEVRYATALHDYARGCGLGQLLDCHFVDYVIGVAAGPLAPDVAAVPVFADYAAGQDTAMRAIAARLAAEG
jgi:hypothetical protein